MDTVRTFQANVVVVFVRVDDLTNDVGEPPRVHIYGPFRGFQHKGKFGPTFATDWCRRATSRRRYFKFSQTSSDFFPDDQGPLLRNLEEGESRPTEVRQTEVRPTEVRPPEVRPGLQCASQLFDIRNSKHQVTI